MADDLWFDKFYKCINITEAKKIMDRLSEFGDDKTTGNRSAGSKASEDAAFYLFHRFQNIGLKHVTKERVSTAKWEYHGAQFTYMREDGRAKTVQLGGYASKYDVNGEWIAVVDGGEGTSADFDQLGDVKGKLILVNIEDIWNGYWVSYPNLEAMERGARGILLSINYKHINEKSKVSLAVGSPQDAVAMAISLQDAKELRKQIHNAKEKQVMVHFVGHSKVEPNAFSYNIWGEIPGRSKQVIYLIAHYDGYYHSYFDDAFGVSLIIGIAKAIIGTGCRPEKTIRVIAHAAEEWGRVDSDYDWATGAYEQIVTLHPEWVKHAFALINIDGNFPVPKERSFQIKTSMEFYEGVNTLTKQYLDGCGYEFQIIMPTSTMSEEFIYAKQGIPCIVAADSFQESIYFTHIYHSTEDAKSFGFDYNTYYLLHALYGRFVFELDGQRIRPMRFDTRFSELEKSLPKDMVPRKCILLVREVIHESEKLSNKINVWNTKKERNKYEEDRFNDALALLSHEIQKRFLRLDWKSNLVFPHENCQRNLYLLRKAMEEVRRKDADWKRIVEKYIKPIDMNQHVLQFSYKTYSYLAERRYLRNERTWGWGCISDPNEDLYELAHKLTQQRKDKLEDYRSVFHKLEEAYNHQESYYHRILKEEEEALYYVKQLITSIINSF